MGISDERAFFKAAYEILKDTTGKLPTLPEYCRENGIYITEDLISHPKCRRRINGKTLLHIAAQSNRIPWIRESMHKYDREYGIPCHWYFTLRDMDGEPAIMDVASCSFKKDEPSCVGQMFDSIPEAQHVFLIPHLFDTYLRTSQRRSFLDLIAKSGQIPALIGIFVQKQEQGVRALVEVVNYLEAKQKIELLCPDNIEYATKLAQKISYMRKMPGSPQNRPPLKQGDPQILHQGIYP
jgi:hypothetical protein